MNDIAACNPNARIESIHLESYAEVMSGMGISSLNVNFSETSRSLGHCCSAQQRKSPTETAITRVCRLRFGIDGPHTSLTLQELWSISHCCIQRLYTVALRHYSVYQGMGYGFVPEA
ncbi:hypothetical protein LZ554_003576 [Drepanopeziza brunnea f. sp. 'monogermtubi']|nr:hypothetical protein LZ554_003576 [Drepanopeziza brunnea f. sp. 'monogermtubi']